MCSPPTPPTSSRSSSSVYRGCRSGANLQRRATSSKHASQHTIAQIGQSSARETARVITQVVIPEMERTIGTSDKRGDIYAALHPTLERLARDNPEVRDVQLSFAKLLAAEGGDLLIRKHFEDATDKFQQGLERIEEMLRRAPDDIELAREQAFGVLLGRMHPRAKLDSDIQYMLGEVFGTDRVFETSISETVRHREATVYCKTILEHAPDEPAAEQFHSVARELFARVRQAERGGETTTDQPKRKVANG
jgi:hypothetical protein